MSESFEDILKQVNEIPTKKLSVANAQDLPVMEAVAEAKAKKIADPILVGDEEKIREIAKQINFDLSDVRVINEPDMQQAALTAVKLVHDGEADMYMKGALDSKTFLRSVLNKDVGLRTGKTLSHVCVFEIKGIKRLLFLTDVAFLPYPTLEDKEQIINYTVDVCNACGIQNPKVAPLAAVEVVNPKMPVTVEAAQLTKWNEEGRIKNCIVDGPLSMDLAIDPEAAKHKAGAENRKIVGDADVLLFPDIHAGNLVYKTIVHLCEFKNGCILMGTKAPVILTSRSDSKETKINSIALAAVVAHHQHKI
ncbi:MAG: phosphate butyryltransferase [Lachnospiraceae bacterium]|jgi:phosphate butyryltransferase|nr:phosphate butyryltransferase [Lachnospiraceae bacterium]MCI1398520.1 phosphate butyryltransferase [Lachnospiraceae bacterium]MCI1424702.1 phosphate butyryltransferase [Lachnospiraceae bacterium]MCI1453439.1 phosphate butyryltransferase [Lachnospiraceae bacterium]MDD5847854.1 phosphate butyryltransferase [Bacillota bacterium]